jgi:CHAT domain-containing protein
MSLWSVDDEATQELMSLFYKEMLGGKTQHEAFRMAQQQLKLKFKQPFYWGAFIMVGE